MGGRGTATGGADYTRGPVRPPIVGHRVVVSRREVVAILCPMLDEVRRYVRGGVQAFASAGPDDLFERVQGLAARAASFATMMAQWWTEARDSLLREVRDVAVRQVEEMGLATKQDVETLRRRLDRLEAETRPARSGGSGRTGRKSGAGTRRGTAAGTSRGTTTGKTSAAARTRARSTRTPARTPPRRRASGPGSGSSDTPVTG